MASQTTPVEDAIKQKVPIVIFYLSLLWVVGVCRSRDHVRQLE